MAESRSSVTGHHSSTHGRVEMGNAQKDIADFGPLDIIRESLYILKNNAKVLVSIQLCLGLMSVVLAQIIQFSFLVFMTYLISTMTAAMGPDLHEEQLFLTHRLSVLPHIIYPRSSAISVESIGLIEILGILVLTVLIDLVLMAIEGLSIAANIYAVGVIYIGRRVSFLSVLKGAIPRRWIRLVLTLTIYVLFSYLVIYSFTGFVFFFSTSRYFSSSTSRIIPLLTTLVVFFVLMTYLSMLYMVASASSVLDENYGLAAFKASVKLLRGRKWVAFWVVFLYSIVGTFLSGLGTSNSSKYTKDPWAYGHLLLIAIQTILLTFMKQLRTISSGVAYMSFKGYHRETLSTDFYLQDENEEYENLPENDAAGQHREDIV